MQQQRRDLTGMRVACDSLACDTNEEEVKYGKNGETQMAGNPRVSIRDRDECHRSQVDTLPSVAERRRPEAD